MTDSKHSVGTLLAVGAVGLLSAVVSNKLSESVIYNQIIECANFATKKKNELSQNDWSSFQERGTYKDLVFANCVQQKLNIKF